MIKSVHTNILETSVVSLVSGTENSNFPLYRLFDRNVGRMFKPTLAETVEILVDQSDGPRKVDRLLVPSGHNLDGVAFDLRHSDDDMTYLSVLGSDDFGGETDQNLIYRAEESDEFETGTQQDMKDGGDGEKSFGWNVLNSSSADAIDVNISNAGKLTIDCNAVNSKLGGNDFTCPYIYKNITGDFDVETSHTDNGDQNFEDAGIVVRDPNASGGEDHIDILFRATEGKIYVGNTANSVSNWESHTAIHRLLRITRIGNIFTLYSKASPVDAWTVWAQYVRSDVGNAVQLGVIARTGNVNNNFVAEFDFFRSHGDGSKQHGWRVINSASAEEMVVNQSNPGKLTIACNTVSSKISNAVFSVPFVYKEMTGDFDVATCHADNGDTNYEDAGIIVRDQDASVGEDWLAIFYRPVEGRIWSGYTTNSFTAWQDGGVNTHRHLRVSRTGDVFTLYSKATAVDAWTRKAQYMRSDFGTTIQVGVFAATQNTDGKFVVQFDWFRNIASSGMINKSFAPVTRRYWRFIVMEPAGVPEVAEIFLAETYKWERNPSRPAGPFEPEFNVDDDVTSGGQDRFLICGDPKQRRLYHMTNCSETQKDNIIGLYRAWAGSKPFWLCDHEGKWIYGRLRAPLHLREESYGKYSFGFDFLEVLP